MKRIGRFFKWLLAVIVIVYMALFLVGWVLPVAQPEEASFDFDRPVVIAHQGGDGLRPSNTMAAFNHAAELGVDVLEMDIHSTRDGVLVTIHDSTVDRTTDGIGRVLELTFEQIQALDAGYHWPTLAEESGRTDRPYRGQGIVIPALEEVLQTFPEMPMNIEIKQSEPSIVDPFCDLLKTYDRVGDNRVLVASFHESVIVEFREKCPGVPTSVVQNEVIEFYLLSRLRLHRLWSPPAAAFQVPQSFSGLTVITPKFVQHLQEHGVLIHPWTINDQNDMEILLRMGVDGIITDYPDRLIEARQKVSGEQ